MNQSEETIVAAPTDQQEPHPNGQDRNEKCKTAYQGLQKLIGHEIAQIDKILRTYYDEFGGDYFLVAEPPHRYLFKWTIAKSGPSSTVEVFFKGKAETQPNAQAAQQAAGAPPPPLQNKLVQTDETQSADIYTYDEVGAPPSGPTPAKPPSNP